MSVELRVVEDPAAVCAELLIDAASEGGDIVLAGGSTPRAAYQAAASAGTSWARATAWFGDERCVAPDDERSNYAMAKAALLDPLGEAGPTVMRIRGELGPTAAADDYEQDLRAAGPPPFDLLLLGLGPDGHTASLFPGSPALDADPGRLVTLNRDPNGRNPFDRMTLTFSGISRARLVIFTVSGASKREAMQAVADGIDVPAGRVRAERVVWLVDAAASPH